MIKMTCFKRIKIIATLLQLLCSYTAASFSRDPRNDFYHHAIIYPTLYEEQLPQKNLNSLKDVYEAQLVVLKFAAFGKSFVVNLKENKNLFSPNYKEIYEEDGNEVIYKPVNEIERRCYYQGQLPNVENSWAAISTCNGVSGIISDGKETYFIEPNHMPKNAEHLLFKASDYKDKYVKCGVKDSTRALEENDTYFNRMKVKYLRDPYKSNNESLYIEVVVVNDRSMYEKYNRSLTSVFERDKQILNVANSILSRLNIFLVLQTIRVWMKENLIPITQDGVETLDNFLKFRKESLLKHDPNDNAILITNQEYDDFAAGNAYVRGICTEDKSAESIYDSKPVAGLVGATAAHEIGHNLGADHDDNRTECICPVEHCVMHPYLQPKIPTKWTECSRYSIYLTHAGGLDSCLRNKPTKVEGPSCGNGFLEDGEECDCGIKEFCEDPCCDATTCRKTRCF